MTQSTALSGNGGTEASGSAGAATAAGSANAGSPNAGGGSSSLKTFANPLNIDYHFPISDPSRNEAADPAMVLYKDVYYLFAS